MNILSPISSAAIVPPRTLGATGRLRFLARIRFQLLGALLVAVLLPALFKTELSFLDTGLIGIKSSTGLTTLATAIAVIAGGLTLRRMANFPGARSAVYVLPILAASFAIVIAAVFFARVDYSRAQFLLSFMLAVGWFLFVSMIERRVIRPRYLVLPFGNAPSVLGLPGAEWRVAQGEPEVPDAFTAVVADLRAELSEEWQRTLSDATLRGIPVYHFKQLSEAMTGRVEIEHLSENNLGSLLPSSLYLRFQRMGDLFLALVTLPLTLPLVALAALAIKLGDRGPAFFRQERMGYRGRTFMMLKLRTMHVDADKGSQFTTAGDPRVTRVGLFLRKTRIDELPQIFNIIKGEMSWIGPRPEPVWVSRLYEEKLPFYRYRHILRPGITGWAQVKQGYVGEDDRADHKLHYDFYYIKYYSLWLDLLIVGKTIRTMLFWSGAR